MSDERCCLTCAKPLVRRDGEKPYKFRQRNYCDQFCSNAKTKNRSGRNTCRTCSEVFGPRDNEGPATFAKRLYCSHRCHNLAMVKDPPPDVIEKIERLAVDGLSAHALAKEMGLGEKRIAGICKRRGIPIVKRNTGRASKAYKTEDISASAEDETEKSTGPMSEREMDRAYGCGIDPFDPVPARLIAAMPHMPRSELLTLCSIHPDAAWEARRMGLLKDDERIAA